MEIERQKIEFGMRASVQLIAGRLFWLTAYDKDVRRHPATHIQTDDYKLHSVGMTLSCTALR